MHALNIMWLLNEVTNNTHIDIRSVKTKSAAWVEISTKDFDYYIDEYGSCRLKYLDQPTSLEKDQEYWFIVKEWIKGYYQNNL